MPLINGVGINLDAGVLKFIEIKTKLTSLLVFLYCLAFSFQANFDIQLLPTLVFFAGTFFIDLTTTSINNYQGYKREGEKLSVKPHIGQAIIGALLALAIIFGLVLIYLTRDPLIVISGAFCFAIGLTYTTGPLPIAQIPFGEFFSGVLYGFFIPFIYALINFSRGSLIDLQWQGSRLSLSFDWPLMLALLAFSAIPVALVANVMLANNSCDVAKDEAIGRYTLPHYLGRNALKLYAFLNLLSYPLILLLVVFRVFEPWQLLLFLTAPKVYKNTRAFLAKQDKASTFGLALQNLMLIMGVLILSLFVGGLLRQFFG